MNTRILIAIVVSMFVCQQVHAQDDEPVMPEATELEGTWELVSYVRGGEQIDVPDGHQMRYEDNRMYYRKADDEDWAHYSTFSLDTSAMPPEINFMWRVFSDETEFISVLGVYEIDGDSLTICHANPEETRPDVFESSEDYPTNLLVLRRVEEDDE